MCVCHPDVKSQVSLPPSFMRRWGRGAGCCLALHCSLCKHLVLLCLPHPTALIQKSGEQCMHKGVCVLTLPSGLQSKSPGLAFQGDLPFFPGPEKCVPWSYGRHSAVHQSILEKIAWPDSSAQELQNCEAHGNCLPGWGTDVCYHGL